MKPQTPDEAIRELGELANRDWTSFSYVTNLPGEGRELLFDATRCQAPPTISRETLGDRPFDMVAYYAHAVELQAEASGDQVKQVRVVLLNSEGDTLGFVSGGILQSLCLILSSLGCGPWHDDPIPVRVTSAKTAKSRTILRLELAL